MAGQKVVHRTTTVEDGLKDENGAVIIIENGNVEPDDEWALFRLTDDGVYAYCLLRNWV